MAPAQNCFIFAINCGHGLKADEVAAAIKDTTLLLCSFPGLPLVNALGIQIIKENVSEVLYAVQNPFKNTQSLMQAVGEIRNVRCVSSAYLNPKPLVQQIENSYRSFVGEKGKVNKTQWTVTLIYIHCSHGAELLSPSGIMDELESINDVPLDRVVYVSLGSKNNESSPERTATANHVILEERFASDGEELTLLLRYLFLERHLADVPVSLTLPSRKDPIASCLLASSLPLNVLFDQQSPTSFCRHFFRSSLTFEESVRSQQSTFGTAGRSRARQLAPLSIEFHVVASTKYESLSVDVFYDYPMRLASCEPSSEDIFAKLVDLLHFESIVLICRQVRPCSDLHPFVALIPNFNDSRYLIVRRLAISDFHIPGVSSTSDPLSSLKNLSSLTLNDIPTLPTNADVIASLKSNIYTELFKARFPSNYRRK